MLTLHNIFAFVTHYGYYAIVEFVIDLGDQAVVHGVAVIAIKLGTIHVGWKIVKHIRKRKGVKSSKSE